MPSALKTEFLGLNDWQASDHPLMQDFKNDNAILDEFLKNFHPLPILDPNRAMITDGSGILSASEVTAAELAFLSGVTASIQTQLNGKQATISGAASTITGNNLTASRALLSDANGKVGAATVTAAELAFLQGVTSAIQTQLNGKQATITGAASTITGNNLTASRALLSDANGKVSAATVTAAELAFLQGVTSAIQTQLNGKLESNGTAQNSNKVGGHTIYIQSTTPSSPALNDAWIS